MRPVAIAAGVANENIGHAPVLGLFIAGSQRQDDDRYSGEAQAVAGTLTHDKGRYHA
jgi:hypothetical protein